MRTIPQKQNAKQQALTGRHQTDTVLNQQHLIAGIIIITRLVVWKGMHRVHGAILGVIRKAAGNSETRQNVTSQGHQIWIVYGQPSQTPAGAKKRAAGTTGIIRPYAKEQQTWAVSGRIMAGAQ